MFQLTKEDTEDDAGSVGKGPAFDTQCDPSVGSSPVLERDLLGGPGTKHCVCCNALFVPGSNRAKYCRECAPKVRRRQKTEYQRKVRSTVEH